MLAERSGHDRPGDDQPAAGHVLPAAAHAARRTQTREAHDRAGRRSAADDDRWARPDPRAQRHRGRQRRSRGRDRDRRGRRTPTCSPVPNFGGGIYVEGAGALALNRVAVSGNSRAVSRRRDLPRRRSHRRELDDRREPGRRRRDGRRRRGHVRQRCSGVDDELHGGGQRGRGRATVCRRRDIQRCQLRSPAHERDAGEELRATGGLSLAANSTATIANSIVASDAGPACNGAVTAIAGDHNLADDASCGFTAVGDKQGVNPLLGALANNGGPTNTLALAAASPAINARDGLPAHRPARRRAPAARRLRHGRVRVPHARPDGGQARREQPGSAAGAARLPGPRTGGQRRHRRQPGAGSAAGRRYTPAPGTYTVSEDAAARYTRSFSGDCTTSGGSRSPRVSRDLHDHQR